MGDMPLPVKPPFPDPPAPSHGGRRRVNGFPVLGDGPNGTPPSIPPPPIVPIPLPED